MLSSQLLTSLAVAASMASATSNYAKGTVRFLPPFKALDPNHYKTVFTGFQACVKTCDKQTDYTAYGSDAWNAFGVLGDYTACVSACGAQQLLDWVAYYKTTYAKLLDVTQNQLRLTKAYIAGSNDFDFFGNRTRIGYSCVLPDKYFVDWETIMIEVPVYFADRWEYSYSDDDDVTNVYLRADAYLQYCSQGYTGRYSEEDWNALDDANMLGGLKAHCDSYTYRYLLELKTSIGNSFLHPDYASSVPDGACNDRTNCHVTMKPNPKAKRFDQWVCVGKKTIAYYSKYKQVNENPEKDSYDYLTELIVRDINADGSCTDISLSNDEDDYGSPSEWLNITMAKVPASEINIFKVTGVIQFDPEVERCDLNGTLGVNGSTRAFVENDSYCAEYVDQEDILIPNAHSIKAYQWGGFEYSNARQYLNYLSFHATFTGFCEGLGDIVDFIPTGYLYGAATSVHVGLYEGLGLPFFHNHETYSITCLYRIFALKCDCMQAVLNCYELQSSYTSVIGKALGRASSVLCGFILCQKAAVWRLFANGEGLDHTFIMSEVLLQAGQLDASSLPMATMAFVSFGLGMVAFVAAKQLSRPKSTFEDGYANLI